MRVESMLKEVFRYLTKEYCVDVNGKMRKFRYPKKSDGFDFLCFIWFLRLLITLIILFLELCNQNLIQGVAFLVICVFLLRLGLYVYHIVRKRDVWKSDKIPVFKRNWFEALRGADFGRCKDQNGNIVLLSYKKILLQFGTYGLVKFTLDAGISLCIVIVYYLNMHVLIKIPAIVAVVLTAKVANVVIKIRSDDSMWIETE